MSRSKLLIVLLLAALILPQIFPHPFLDPAHKAHAATRSITLYAALSGWNFSKLSGINPTITITKGDTISFNLIGEDSLAHLLLLDFDGNGVTNDCSGGPDKCSGNIPAMGTGSIAPFVVTANAGTYSYYCLYHSPYSMVGTLVVQSPPSGPDYGVSSNPSSLSILQGAGANSTVSVTSVNNFAGTVTLSALPSSPPGLQTSSFNVNPVTVSAGGTAKSNFTISVPASTSLGVYSITVTAKNSTVSHSTTVSVTVTAPDFTVTTSPTILSVNQGSGATLAVTVSSINGFSGPVTLSAQSSTGGPSVNVSPTALQLTSGGSASATITVTTSSSGVYSTPVSSGNYTITLSATGGSLFHTVMIPLMITPPSSGAGILTNPIFIGGIVIAIVIVIAAYLLTRKSKK